MRTLTAPDSEPLWGSPLRGLASNTCERPPQSCPADTAIKDKHGFDTKFEDLFRSRTEEEIAAIKKKYGASGDIREAEQRIAAIARDLVDHYIDNILPDGFKAQVVCHSKLAALRYQKSIRAALAMRLERETLKQKPDAELIRRIGFLKEVVVLSADATNELAAITEARKEARRWNAVENFYKPFNRDDPDKALTGIAFLIVCDMLLTGFDAPVEQVMYIDKRLKEHTCDTLSQSNRRCRTIAWRIRSLLEDDLVEIRFPRRVLRLFEPNRFIFEALFSNLLRQLSAQTQFRTGTR